MLTCPLSAPRKGRCTLDPHDTPLLKTALHETHCRAGAQMVSFGGWDMPVSYSGLIAEHMAVRQTAGLFDVSHMGLFEVQGPGSLGFLQRVTCNDVAKLEDGQSQYSALPRATGCPVDDIIVSRRSEERWEIVVNAGNREKDWAWLVAQSSEECALRDLSDEGALLALQGPSAATILGRLTSADLAGLGNYRFTDAIVDGCPAVISRTGYTGEDGFELRVLAHEAPRLWGRLLETGKEDGLVPCGLGARDTLRLEARMCLYGNDIDETTTLIEAGLGWIVSLDERKGDFVGRSVLAEQKRAGTSRKLVGFEMVGRGIARHGYDVFQQGNCVGPVTSGTFAPFLQKSIGLCYLPSATSAVGTEIEVDIRGRRVAARVVSTPFYKRTR